MHLVLHLVTLSLFLTFSSHEVQVIANPRDSINQYPYKSFVAPITKHPDASLYTVVFDSQPDTRFILDLDAPVSWYPCTEKKPLLGDLLEFVNSKCLKTQSYIYPPSCPPSNRTANGSNCTTYLINPVSKSCAVSDLTFDLVYVHASDGRTAAAVYNTAFNVFSCAPSTLLRSLPVGVTGLAALSSSPLALPAFISGSNMLSLCLPSSSSVPGVIFFGDGPFYLAPHSNTDIRTLLSYTPLITTPNSPEYIISIHAISVDGKKPSVKLGDSTVKLSTVAPYTTLRTSFYKRLVRAFSKATRKVPRAKAIRPFRLCYNTSASGFSWSSFPRISMVMKDGKNWTITGTNSVKQVRKQVGCLAFVDGGRRAEHEMVIGTFQMEDNFLLFDQQKSMFGFSSSLSLVGTSCSNFNF